MKSSILRAGVALACALGLAACGGGDGDLYLSGAIDGGVTKQGLVLQNNGGDDLAIAPNASTFTFSKRISTDDQFNITVKSKPSNVSDCFIQNGSARANYYSIGQIRMYCVIKTHKFEIKVNGLTTSGLVLVNGTDRQEVPAGDATHVMAKVYEDGPYAVKVLQQPAGQTCTVSNGTGIMGSTDDSTNNNVVVTCA